MTIVTSSATEARTTLITLLTQEFRYDPGYPVIGDRLHASVGNNGGRVGVSPVRERPWTRNTLVLQTSIFVQFYATWEEIIDPSQQVDPSLIEGYAERFKRLMNGNDPRTDHTWFFSLDELTYPPDPTDNITRFEATVTAWGNNPTIMETTG